MQGSSRSVTAAAPFKLACLLPAAADIRQAHPVSPARQFVLPPHGPLHAKEAAA